MAQPTMLEVAGLLGRAAVANGHYRQNGQQQCDRPVYVQVVSSRSAARIVYDDGNAVGMSPAWIVEVPHERGKAYALSECTALTPPNTGGGGGKAEWMVWFCPKATSIEDGQDLWYPATDFDGFYVGPLVAPGAPLVRTDTQRTNSASESLESLAAKLGGFEDRVRFLDMPNQKKLHELHSRVSSLGTELDRLEVVGMSGEDSLRRRRGALQKRVQSLLDTLEKQSAGMTQTPPPRSAATALHRHRTTDSSRSTPAHTAPDELEPELEPKDSMPEPEAEAEFVHNTPTKQSRAVDDILRAISLELDHYEDRAGKTFERSAAAASEHSRGFAHSRSTLISSMGSIDRILICLDFAQNSLQDRLDAVVFDDPLQNRDKTDQRKKLNNRLRKLIERLEDEKSKLDKLAQPVPTSLPLQLAAATRVPRVTGTRSQWSSSTVNAVLARTSTGRRASMTGMSATDTPALAWRAVECEEEQEENQRSPDQRRLEGLFAIDPADFAPEFNFDFTDIKVEDEIEHWRGGMPYYRPYGWKRFALDVKDKYSLKDLPIMDLKELLGKGGGKPLIAGMERKQLEQLAAAVGGEQYARAWLGESNSPGEWVNAYHGTCAEVAGSIASNGLRRGRSTGDDSEGVERRNGAAFGSGVYCTPRVEEAELYSEPIEVSADVDGNVTTKYYKVIFQCRVRGPACASHAEAKTKRGFYNVGMGPERQTWCQDYWVVPRQEDVRPYAILMKDCTDEA